MRKKQIESLLRQARAIRIRNNNWTATGADMPYPPHPCYGNRREFRQSMIKLDYCEREAARLLLDGIARAAGPGSRYRRRKAAGSVYRQNGRGRGHYTRTPEMLEKLRANGAKGAAAKRCGKRQWN